MADNNLNQIIDVLVDAATRFSANFGTQQRAEYFYLKHTVGGVWTAEFSNSTDPTGNGMVRYASGTGANQSLRACQLGEAHIVAAEIVELWNPEEDSEY